MPGESLEMFANGLGNVTEVVAPGIAAPWERLAQTFNSPSVVVDGVEIQASFSGLAGETAMFQMNAQFPPTIPLGTAVPLFVKLVLADGTILKSNAVTVAIATAPGP